MQSAQIADLRHAEHSYTTLGVLALPRPALPVVLPTPEGEGCAREAGIARSLLERSLATTAAAPAEIEVMLPALLELATPCGARAAQPDPPERGWPSRGAGFLSWLDARRGAGSPGHLLAGLLGRLDRADLFAVLRDNLKDAEFSRSTLDDTIAAYALEQFSRGARAHWSIDAPHTPRALLTPPIEPFGATALTITMERSLRLETEWEQRAEMRLALQALDAKDQVLTTSWVAVRPRITEANTTFVPPAGTHRVRVVMVHTGDPFDPLSARAAAFEPHAAILTVAVLP